MQEWKSMIVLLILLFQLNIIHSENNQLNIYKAWKASFDSFGDDKILRADKTLLRIVNYQPVTGEYFIHINFLEPERSNSTCKIPHLHGGQTIAAKSLGNGNLLAWFSSSTDFIFYIINPIICQNKTFHFNGSLNAIIPYHDVFDLLDAEENRIYRYSDAGYVIQTFDRLLLFSYFVSRRFDVFKEYDSTADKLVIRRLSDYKSAIDVLNNTYSYVNTSAFDHSIEAYSTAHNKFSLCYQTYNYSLEESRVLQCRILDQKFNTIKNISQIQLYYGSVRSMAMHNLYCGGAIVVYCIPRFVGSCHVYYRRLNTDGTASEYILVEEFGNEDTDIYIFEQNEVSKEYCIVLSGWSQHKSIKCIIA